MCSNCPGPFDMGDVRTSGHDDRLGLAGGVVAHRTARVDDDRRYARAWRTNLTANEGRLRTL